MVALTPDKIILCIAGPDPNLVMRDFMKLLEEDTRFSFASMANNWPSLLSSLELAEPDLFIIYADIAPSPEALAKLLAGLKKAICILLLPSSWASFEGLFRQVTQVRKVYLLPVMPAEVMNAAFSVVRTELATNAALSPLGSALAGRPASALGTRVLGVVSAQGGVGRTTLATALAFELGVRRSVKTLLCSFDLPASLPLNLKMNYSPNASEYFARPGKSGFQDSLQSYKGEENFQVLLAPQETRPYLEAAERSARASQLNPNVQDLAASITELIRTAYTMMYAGIILDLPVGDSPWTWHPLGLANNVLIVARPTLASLKAVGHITKILTTMLSAAHQFQKETIFIALNLHTSGSGFTPNTFHKEAEEAFGWCPPVVATFDYDPALAAAQDAQRPVADVCEKFSSGIQSLTEFFWKGTALMRPKKAKGVRIGPFNFIPEEKGAL
jgi:Flp pilus assembly CpaE family ATPase